MASPPSKFVWYELMTSDPAGAAAFYRSVIGWEAKDSGMPGMDYTIISMGESMVGGIMPIPPEAKAMGVRPGWIGYIAVDDVDAMAQRVQAAGGAIHRPGTDIPGVGRFAVVADPHGAAFIVFKNLTPPPGEPPPSSAPGRIAWHELQTGDVDSGFAFYAKLFGWTKSDAMDMGPMGVYQMFATGGTPVGGMMKRLPEVPASFWLYYVNVDAIDAAVARLRKAGGTTLAEPTEVPGGSWIVQGIDPQGAMFALVAPKR